MSSSSSNLAHKPKTQLNKQPLKKNSNNNNSSSSNTSNNRAWANTNPWRNNSPASNNPALQQHFINSHQQQHPPSSSASSSSSFNNQQHHIHPATLANEEKLVLKAMHDRMLWFIMSLVGVSVIATTRSGQKFQGLLHSAVTEAELCITLKRAIELPVPSTSTSPNSKSNYSPSQPTVKSTLIILAKELVQVVAEDINLNQLSSVGSNNTPKTGAGFKTDSETLGYKLDSNGQPIIREKELQTWVPSPTDLQASSYLGPNQSAAGTTLSESQLMNGLEDSLFPKGTELNPSSNNRRTFDKPWDQFEANEKLFGTRTDFDEEIYTTKLDRSGKDFKERERKAEALAREIMASSSANLHVQEERGIPIVDDSGMDEEDKYGAVIRSEGAYVPPGARKGATANRGTLQPPSSSTANSKQAPSTQTPQNMKITASMPEPASQPELKPSSTTTASKSSNTTKEPLSSKISQQAQTLSKPAASNVTTVNLPSNLSAAKPLVGHKLTKQPEEVAPRFKAFVSDEKERLQQKKKDLLKKEKESRLADLRAFSTSFKLPMAFPKDLEPIIKKSAPSTNSPTTQQNSNAPKQDPPEQTSAQDEANRRASTINPALTDKNHARHMSKPLNPSNLIATNISTQGGRLLANTLVKPPLNPSIAIGLKKLGPLAPIPPFKPRNQAAPTTSSSTEKKSENKPVTQPSKLASRFANLPPIPPFKPKGATNDSNNKDPKAALKAAAFNPAAKTFSPVPGTKAKGPVSPNTTTAPSGRKAAENGSTAPPNPFFGHAPIKKGSSSIHVKEEFTPFKSGNVPEASSVGPAWSFTGKSYRHLFGASIPPPHHHPHFMPHSMHHPMSHHPHHQQSQQQPQQQQQQSMHHHVHQQHPQPHGNHPHGHPPHSQVGHMMTPPMHMQHSQQQPHYSHHPPPPPPPPNVVPQMMADDDGMSGPMNGGAGGHMVAGGPNSHVVNGPGMMMGGGGGGPPGSGGPGYMAHNGPGMNQQQQQQPHPHHLPPPIPPYMYHPQHHPQQQSPISPYNNGGSYRQPHGSTGPGGTNLGYGPPVPVNMAGPVPAPGYGSGPPVVTVPGNPAGAPFVPQLPGYPPGSIHPPSHNSAGGPGNSPVNNGGGPPVHYSGSPQMGGMPGHGPPGGMYPPPQMYPPGGDSVGGGGGGGGGHGSHGPHNGHGGGHGHGHHGGGHHHHNSHSSGHGHHGHGGGHHSNGPSPAVGPGGGAGHMGAGRGRGNSGAGSSSAQRNNQHNQQQQQANNNNSNSNPIPAPPPPAPANSAGPPSANNSLSSPAQSFNYPNPTSS